MKRKDMTNAGSNPELIVSASSVNIFPWSLFLDELNVNIRWHTRVARFSGQLKANQRIAGACIIGDPNRAMIQDPSTSFEELIQLPLLPTLSVGVDQCRHPELVLG